MGPLIVNNITEMGPNVPSRRGGTWGHRLFVPMATKLRNNAWHQAVSRRKEARIVGAGPHRRELKGQNNRRGEARLALVGVAHP